MQHRKRLRAISRPIFSASFSGISNPFRIVPKHRAIAPRTDESYQVIGTHATKLEENRKNFVSRLKSTLRKKGENPPGRFRHLFANLQPQPNKQDTAIQQRKPRQQANATNNQPPSQHNHLTSIQHQTLTYIHTGTQQHQRSDPKLTAGGPLPHSRC